MHHSNTLKLGWLFPWSGVFSNLKADLRQGLETALHIEGVKTPFEVYPAFIQTGALKDTEDALKKLLLFDEVDLVIGVTSTKVALGLLPVIGSQRTPCILLNLGADTPTASLRSGYLFYNSLHLWKSEWVMGNWAQQRYGGEPSLNMSVYEGGYSLHDAFRIGSGSAGAETVKINLVRNYGDQVDTRPLIAAIRDQEPKQVHALLSGREAAQFLELYRDNGLASRSGLTVNPFMTEEGMSMQGTWDQPVYNAMTWSHSLDTAPNQEFTQTFSILYGKPANAFSLLAYEAGLGLAAAITAVGGKISREGLATALRGVQPSGPRGKIQLSTTPLETSLPVYIRQAVLNAHTQTWENRILEKLDGIEWNDPTLIGGPPSMSGWQNPYLCV